MYVVVEFVCQGYYVVGFVLIIQKYIWVCIGYCWMSECFGCFVRVGWSIDLVIVEKLFGNFGYFR